MNSPAQILVFILKSFKQFDFSAFNRPLSATEQKPTIRQKIKQTALMQRIYENRDHIYPSIINILRILAIPAMPLAIYMAFTKDYSRPIIIIGLILLSILGLCILPLLFLQNLGGYLNHQPIRYKLFADDNPNLDYQMDYAQEATDNHLPITGLLKRILTNHQPQYRFTFAKHHAEIGQVYWQALAVNNKQHVKKDMQLTYSVLNLNMNLPYIRISNKNDYHNNNKLFENILNVKQVHLKETFDDIIMVITSKKQNITDIQTLLSDDVLIKIHTLFKTRPDLTDIICQDDQIMLISNTSLNIGHVTQDGSIKNSYDNRLKQLLIPNLAIAKELIKNQNH